MYNKYEEKQSPNWDSPPAALANAEFSFIEDLSTRFAVEQIVQVGILSGLLPLRLNKKNMLAAYPFCLKAGFHLTRR